MAWPIASQYQDAVLNSQSSFENSELKIGKPELDGQGFPRPRSGQFACVFRIQSKQRDWAVKCFTQEVKDLQERYAKIDDYISISNLPYMVEFDYLAEGIRVDKKWYPILKMEWVQGELLGKYIERQLNNPHNLQQLALRWAEMIKVLQAKSIAHGDLQERNVIVVNGQLKLVDYDGMFVPALNGGVSHEIGHPNYQHPKRTAKDFGPFLDNFSAWVIYVSLVALSIDPTLWARTKAGDECLLFRKADFEQPMLSPTLALLDSHPNQNIRMLATLFRSMLFFPPHQVPSLDGQVAPAIQSQVPYSSSQGSWWSDHALVGQEKNSTATVNEQSSFPNALWVLDFVSSPDKVKERGFSQSMFVPRLVAFLSGNFMVLTVGVGIALPIVFTDLFPLESFYTYRWFFVLFLLTGMLVCLNGIMLIWSYIREPAVLAKGTYSTRARNANEPLKKLEGVLNKNAKEKGDLQAAERQQRKKLNDTLTQLRNRQQAELNEVQETQNKTIVPLNTRRKALDQAERDEMGKLNTTIGSKLSSLNQQVASIANAESNEIARELTTIQNRYIENNLISHRIHEAPIPGQRLEQALLARGIYTANDISYARVSAVQGFGTKRTQALVNWRGRLEQQARFTMPRDLSPDTKNAIKSKYVAQRDSLESQRDIEQAKFTTEEKVIRDRYKVARQSLDADQATAQTLATQKVQEINKRYAQEYAAPTQTLARLATEFGDKYRLIDERNRQVRQEMFSVSWQIAKINHEYETYRDISFSKYLKAVFFGRRAV